MATNSTAIRKAKSLGSDPYVYGKQGWMKKRSRHLKQWRKRYTIIEENKYLCTYHNDTMTNCTERIDITESTIYYTINKPKEFQIYLNKHKNINNNKEFYFECDSILDTNEWLASFKKINITASNNISAPNSPKQKKSTKKKNEMNDFNLIPTLSIASSQNVSEWSENYKNEEFKDTEIDELYMKAVSLYQHKHFEECERITKSVLTMNPKHKQAIQLCAYLVNKKYETETNENNKNTKKKKKNIRQRFKTVAVTKSGKNENNKKKVKQSKRKTFALFGKKNQKNTNDDNNEIENIQQKYVKDAAELTLKSIEDEKKEEIKQIHPCQLEFKRFLMERIQLNKYYNDLCERFEIAKYDDIRFLKDFDKQLLSDEIGLRPLHIKCFLRKIEIFMDEIKLFHQWLKNIVQKQKLKERFNNVTSDGLIDLFENNGINTFEALYRYIKTQNDLHKIIIGLDDNETKFNKIIFDVLWNEMHKIEKTQTLRISMVEQSYTKVNGSVLGITHNNNKNNENGNFIIPEQQSIDNQISEDSFNCMENEGIQNETAYI